MSTICRLRVAVLGCTIKSIRCFPNTWAILCDLVAFSILRLSIHCYFIHVLFFFVPLEYRSIRISNSLQALLYDIDFSLDITMGQAFKSILTIIITITVTMMMLYCKFFFSSYNGYFRRIFDIFRRFMYSYCSK